MITTQVTYEARQIAGDVEYGKRIYSPPRQSTIVRFYGEIRRFPESCARGVLCLV